MAVNGMNMAVPGRICLYMAVNVPVLPNMETQIVMEMEKQTQRVTESETQTESEPMT